MSILGWACGNLHFHESTLRPPSLSATKHFAVETMTYELYCLAVESIFHVCLKTRHTFQTTNSNDLQILSTQETTTVDCLITDLGPTEVSHPKMH